MIAKMSIGDVEIKKWNVLLLFVGWKYYHFNNLWTGNSCFMLRGMSTIVQTKSFVKKIKLFKLPSNRKLSGQKIWPIFRQEFSPNSLIINPENFLKIGLKFIQVEISSNFLEGRKDLHKIFKIFLIKLYNFYYCCLFLESFL
jgi:hypothetical protein